MLEAVFSFRGRIGRLRYFLSVMALMFAALLAFVPIMLIVGAAGGLSAAPEEKPPLLLIGLLVLVLSPPFFWISFSLQARRFRDIGWNPLYVIPAWLTVDLIDQLTARAVPTVDISPHNHETIVGALINLAMGCALAFWPGNGGEDAAPPSDAFWPAPDEPAPRPPAPAPVQAPAFRSAPPPQRAAPVNAGFGRRGL